MASITFLIGYVLPRFTTTQHPNSTPAQLVEVLSATGFAVFIGGPVFVCGSIYGSSVAIQLCSQCLLGEPLNVQAAEEIARMRLGRLLTCGIRELFVRSSGLLIGGSLLFFGGLLAKVTPESDFSAGVLALIGGIAVLVGFFVYGSLMLRRSLIIPIAALESIPFKAIPSRNRELMKAWSIHRSGASSIGSSFFVAAIVGFAICGGLQMAASLIGLSEWFSSITDGLFLQPILVAALNSVPVFIALWVAIPFWSAITTTLYYERRVRIEGFDIEQLAEELRGRNESRFNV